jgi:hypothetical protein
VLIGRAGFVGHWGGGQASCGRLKGRLQVGRGSVGAVGSCRLAATKEIRGSDWRRWVVEGRGVLQAAGLV